MRRPFLLLAGILLALAVSAPAASASSLTLSVQDTSKPNPITVGASGTADHMSKLMVYGELGGTSCSTDYQEHQASHRIDWSGAQDVNAGSFAVQFSQAVPQTGKYLFCGFLYSYGASPTIVAIAGPITTARPSAARVRSL